MPSYLELFKESERLKLEAETARKLEVAAVVAEIKAKIAELGITAEDLGYATKARVKQAKYRDPASGRTWTGKGRRPSWIDRAVAA